ncbi:MAG: VWA domain-containing protein [Thermoanaerobaculia bacterium]
MTSLRRLVQMSTAVLLLSPLSPLRSQEAPPEESFGESIEVSVVNLDVFVTDKKGNPVTGLQKEDFEVLEDGKPVEIANFYAETGGPVASEAKEGAAPALPPPDQRLRLVVFVDDVNLGPRSRTQMLQRIGDFLRAQVSPGDEVMVVRMAERLEVRLSFTSDLAPITTELTSLMSASNDLRKYAESREHAFDDLIRALELQMGWGPLAEARLRAWAEQEAGVVKGALAGLDTVVSWLAGVPGRRAILYVSDGLPLTPGDDLLTWASLRSGYRGSNRHMSGTTSTEYDLTRQFREVTSHASRNRVAIYPLESYGARTSRGSLMQDVGAMNRQMGLRFLASDTGGQALLNAADPLVALKGLGTDMDSYYSLGYTPPRPGDDLEHKVEVRVKAKGVSVRHRPWYRDKPVSEAVAERTLGVMRFGPEENPLEASLEIGEAKAQGETMMVPVRVKVPLARLFLRPGEGKRSGRLRIYIVAGGEGSTTPVRQTKLVTVDVPEAEAAAGPRRDYTHEIAIPLKQGSYWIGVGVRDELAAATSYLRREFVVAPAPGPKGPG